MKLEIDVQNTKSCDVLVVGGGVAGVAAAVAAARHGAKVILTEKQCMLGGLATAGMIIVYLPLCDGCGNQIMAGLAEELLRLSIEHGCGVGNSVYPTAWFENGPLEEKMKHRFQVDFNAALFAISAEKLLLSLGVEIMYDTKAVATRVENGKITHVYVNNKEDFSAVCPQQVVDASGDADICAFSGAKTEEFNENRLGMWHYYMGPEGKAKLGISSVPLHVALQEGRREYRGIPNQDTCELLFDIHDETIKFMQKQRTETGDNNIQPLTIQTMAPLRMTRRLSGVYTLDEKEVYKDFPDSIGKVSDWRYAGPVFSVPYRCLYGADVKNLYAAGRCISVTTDMWDITRVIPDCAVTGQAAGTAAALCAKEGKQNDNLDVLHLQNLLREDGVNL